MQHLYNTLDIFAYFLYNQSNRENKAGDNHVDKKSVLFIIILFIIIVTSVAKNNG